MNVPDKFFDTNVLLYLLSSDDSKANKSEELIQQGGHISIQVLNEFASVSTRKLKMAYADIQEILTPIRAICVIHPLTEAIHDLGFSLSERYRLSIYDAMIVASALTAECKTLFSEDMQDGLVILQTLRICNPFHKGQ
ncbi:MAG: PIN domain-containing protein [Rhodocyclaceae bacterium]|nr:PIN domain-containing protein [Rhodocyclaceae bacterium]